MVYSFVQIVMKGKFGMYADENGEKALHTLLHVTLKHCGRRFGIYKGWVGYCLTT
jgi:hypothetical protein